MSLTILNYDNSLILVNTIYRVSINVADSSGTLIDPFRLKLNVFDLGGTSKLTDEWPGPPTPTRIVQNTTGKFYVDFGSAVPNDETDSPQEYLFDWEIELVSGGKITHTAQKVKVISVKTASYLPEFRHLLDKSKKLVNTSNDCFLGYTDAQMLYYLEGGLQSINAYQPSLTFTMENFPLTYKQILLDAGLITGAMSQQLFAIDTDIPNYSDQGTSFVITHQAQLASFLNQVTQRLDKLIPMMKLQLIGPGSLHTQMGPNFRLQTLVEASPSGSLFRGIFFRS